MTNRELREKIIKIFEGIYYKKRSKKYYIDKLESLDVSKVKDFSNVFKDDIIRIIFIDKDVNKALSKWDVSNGENFSYMFKNVKLGTSSELTFLYEWDLRNAVFMNGMFRDCKVKGLSKVDISKLNVSSKLKNMVSMFAGSTYSGKGFNKFDFSNIENLSSFLAFNNNIDPNTRFDNIDLSSCKDITYFMNGEKAFSSLNHKYDFCSWNEYVEKNNMNDENFIYYKNKLINYRKYYKIFNCSDYSQVSKDYKIKKGFNKIDLINSLKNLIIEEQNESF